MPMRSIALDTYAIFLGPLSNSFPNWLKNQDYNKLAILVDENTRRCCLPLLKPVLQESRSVVIEIPPGEVHKNISTCQSILQQCFKAGLDRKSLMINLGGGVIGDMGGFCASIFMRGIDFVQLPTTLLAQVDASVGGKVGIDFLGLKNALGRFQNPNAVFVDPAFLQTLPQREIRSGFAEMIKHALIAGKEEWKKLQTISSLEQVGWEDWIYQSILIKKQIVESDFDEKGVRKVLNLGHTIGHALESQALQTPKPLLHGEAVAIGIICEAFLSSKLLGFPIKKVEEIARFILTFFEKYQIPEDRFEELYFFMQKDKKNEKNQILFSLLEDIGTPLFNYPCTYSDILESLNYYRNLVLL